MNSAVISMEVQRWVQERHSWTRTRPTRAGRERRMLTVLREHFGHVFRVFFN